jgi:uncharacterized membrane protein
MMLLGSVHLVRGARWLLGTHSQWMAVNLALAVLPLVLAVTLFRSRRRRGPLWWAGFALFVVFLPNAPYVVTDLVHLAPDIRSAPSRKAVVLGLVPLYGAFILAGVESYVLCLRLLRGEVRRWGWRWGAVIAEGAVQTASIIGVLLGRIDRLNSWDILQPARVAAGLATVARHPIDVAVTAVVVLGATYTTEKVDGITLHALRRAAAHLHDLR